jgi:phenylalanyl-tRNA synthetase beta chain
VDAYDAVDAVGTVLACLGVTGVRIVPAPVPGFAAGAAARVTAAGAPVGVVGVLADASLAAESLPGPAVAFELDLDALADAPRRDGRFATPSPYPPSGIDLALVVDDAVPAADLVATLRAAAGDLAEAAWCFDEFRDDRLGAGRRSLAVSLRIRAADRTLTDAEVAAVRDACVAAAAAAHGATLRT